MFTKGVYGSKNLYQAMKEKAAEAEKEGKKPYTIPVGGSTPVGDYGYLRAWRELEEQREKLVRQQAQQQEIAKDATARLAGLESTGLLSVGRKPRVKKEPKPAPAPAKAARAKRPAKAAKPAAPPAPAAPSPPAPSTDDVEDAIAKLYEDD